MKPIFTPACLSIVLSSLSSLAVLGGPGLEGKLGPGASGAAKGGSSDSKPMAGPVCYPTHGTIERLDPALDALLDPDARMEKLSEGFNWSEGPTWLRGERAIVFSDVPENRVYRWSEKDGLSVYLEPSGYTGDLIKFREQGSNGLTTDPEGHLVLCQHGDRQIATLVRREGVTGTYAPLVSRFGPRRFNSPNDLVFSRKGGLYFTDPPYGLEGLDASPLKELMFNGVYLRRSDGTVVLLTRELTFPNGIALSPDEKTLYVNVSDPNRPVVMAYDVQPNGTIAHGRVFFDTAPLLAKGLKGNPDGLKVDRAGNLWTTGPGGVLVLSPTGKHLGTLLTGEATGNCAWGDDGSTLYITADMYLLRVKTRVKGYGPWGR
ncbi:MAG: SMP-30/gluconolactonase/LRE family protein [Verrucomicrobiales bacterium]|nr:SMP-30/gluconolactonase/LRE family protein [Verrucomicrobiales bacterium]